MPYIFRLSLLFTLKKPDVVLLLYKYQSFSGNKTMLIIIGGSIISKYVITLIRFYPSYKDTYPFVKVLSNDKIIGKKRWKIDNLELNYYKI